MSRRSLHIRVAIATSVIVVSVVALVWWSSAGRPLSAALSPSELLSKRPAGTVRVESVVVSCKPDDGGLIMVVADESTPDTGVLTMRYTGTQQVSFGRGVVVIAFGRLMPNGVFGADEFIVKKPTRSRG